MQNVLLPITWASSIAAVGCCDEQIWNIVQGRTTAVGKSTAPNIPTGIASMGGTAIAASAVSTIPLGAAQDNHVQTYESLKMYRGIAMGQKVCIKDCFAAYAFSKGLYGHVREIVKDAKVYFCVQLCDDTFTDEIRFANRKRFVYPNQDDSWMSCTIGHLAKL